MKRSIPDYPQAVLILLVIVTGAALLFAGSTSTVAFGVYNPAWDGASGLQSEADAVGIESEILRNTTGYPTTETNGTLAVILSPQTAYGPAATDRISGFVRSGGTLLVAEDFGNHTNDLLAAIGAQARIDGRTLRDERNYYRAPVLPIATNVSDHRFTEGVERLTLNHGTVVQPNNATVLINSSEYAYLDTNRNGELDADESLGPRPVGTVEELGEGRVIVVSDPSIFINAMLDRPGNRAFVRTLLRNHDRLLLDYSHAGDLPPLSAALLVLRDTPFFQFVLGCIGIGAIGLLLRDFEGITRVREWWSTQEHAPPRAEPEELASVVRERHPEWDDERVERIVQAINTRRENVSTDE